MNKGIILIAVVLGVVVTAGVSTGIITPWFILWYFGAATWLLVLDRGFNAGV